MRTRIEFRNELQRILGFDRLYFQPPESLRMKYPCVVYGFSRYFTQNADDKHYMDKRVYSVTIIDENPDSEFPDKMLQFPYCRFDRSYALDNMNHWVYTVTF